MLHSILKRKVTIDGVKEDSFTSSVIGLMQYLPCETFWFLLREACSDKSNLPQIAGSLIGLQFWPRWDATGIKGRKYIEPDVFLEFTNFDLIIEAKRGDDGGQYEDQWKNQIRAYCNERTEEKKKLFYITLGGNSNKLNEKVSIEYEVDQEKIACETTINKCNWMGLLMQVYRLKDQLMAVTASIPHQQALIRILNDLIVGFNYHGFFHINWFQSMPSYSIRKESLFTFSSLQKFENLIHHE
ncbi:MAG: hypothetical protein ACEPOZ_19945 [Marinifilaceae bacterium]